MQVNIEDIPNKTGLNGWLNSYSDAKILCISWYNFEYSWFSYNYTHIFMVNISSSKGVAIWYSINSRGKS